MDSGARGELEKRLLVRQSQRCFICDDPIDLTLHGGELDIDHIDPLVEQGLDAENNFALTHAPCNRSKGATNLEVARRLSEFGRLQAAAQAAGERGANLGHVLKQHGGSTHRLALRRDASSVEYSLPGCGDHQIHRLSIFRDTLSQMGSFFAVLPLEYLHHDDRINPRSIGGNIRGLIEEFKKGRPQLQIALGGSRARMSQVRTAHRARSKSSTDSTKPQRRFSWAFGLFPSACLSSRTQMSCFRRIRTQAGS